jgi:hypothetical protein
VSQTKQALDAYRPASTHYLSHSEQSFYDALVARDSEFFHAVAAQVRAILESLETETAYCDAVEFYNPVHDIALPIVRAALADSDTTVVEIPLIYQKVAPLETFELQRVPDSLSGQSVWVELSEEELERKIATLESGIYQALFAQLGPVILTAMQSRGAREQFLKGRATLPAPAREQVLRYERRGTALKELGAVREVITYDEHYVPIFEALCGLV